MNSPLRLGSRGSPLARAQSGLVQASLAQSYPALKPELIIIRTTGDQWALQSKGENLPSDKGLFTKELEEALLADQIDVAIHSLKDLPVDFHPALALSAILPRADARDVLITRDQPREVSELPPQAIIATGSLRRSAQLRMARPDLQIVDIRGNIDTRLRKLRENPAWHGLILAAAGLDRLHPDLQSLAVSPLDFALMLPAPGQGAIALQGRRLDPWAARFLSSLNCFETTTCITAERAFLQALGGGCRAPVGAYATLRSSRLVLEGIYFPDPLQLGRRGSKEGASDQPVQLGRELAMELMNQ